MNRRLDINPKKVVAAYRMIGNMAKTAEQLHISFWKVREVLRAEHYPTKPKGGASHKGTVKIILGNKSMANWLRAHPDVLLPRRLSAIAKITGCSEIAVRDYLSLLRRKGYNIPMMRRTRRKCG